MGMRELWSLVRGLPTVTNVRPEYIPEPAPLMSSVPEIKAFLGGGAVFANGGVTNG